MKKEEIISVVEKHYLPVFTRQPVVFDRGQGAVIYDIDGKEYLDFFAGIAVSILGHNHPALVAALSRQSAKLIHTTNIFYTEIQANLVKKLVDLSGLDRVFLANSGTEAIEGAIKLARKYGLKNGGKFKIISALNSFHGRTLGALAATGQVKYHKGFDPILSGFEYVDFNDSAALKSAFDDETCAVLLEPIQGEGGIIEAHEEFLKTAADLCSQNNALLIFDEIQSGIFRSGKPFCWQHFGIKPDIMTIAKALGGGFPIGAILCNEKVAAAIDKGDHGSTFGGGPLACAAAVSVLDTAEELKLDKKAQELGGYMMGKLRDLKKEFPFIKEVRGKGLLIGMEIDKDGSAVVKKALEKGLIINCTSTKVIRFCPPLIIGKEDVDKMITILKESLR
ncbi:MAG: aspartate aminotransferase family protein [Elusimicrobiota bacterium]|jgi:acetylornithine/N-succinyldiaminopimelate aminotransferase|nr:aspartate aminotransferase family protein [Elusimicrobiota bacterium]